MAENPDTNGSTSEKIKISDEAVNTLTNNLEGLRGGISGDHFVQEVQQKINRVLGGSSPAAQALTKKIDELLESASKELGALTDTKLVNLKNGIITAAQRLKDADQDNEQTAGGITSDVHT